MCLSLSSVELERHPLPYLTTLEPLKQTAQLQLQYIHRDSLVFPKKQGDVFSLTFFPNIGIDRVPQSTKIPKFQFSLSHTHCRADKTDCMQRESDLLRNLKRNNINALRQDSQVRPHRQENTLLA